ncbi:MAG: hypothetical protein ACFB50_15575 [Rubrobacteraceae bacterium]
MAQQTTDPVKSHPAKTAPGSATEAPDKSTRLDRVDVFRAEDLADEYPELSAVMIREVFEGEPVERAVGLIRWARKKAPRSPYRQYRRLKGWARRHRRGFYNPAVRKRYHQEERRQYTAYLEQKRAEKERVDGRSALLPSEVVALTEAFYSPSYRAELTIWRV